MTDGLLNEIKKDRLETVYLTKSFFSLGRSLPKCFGCSYCRANDGTAEDFEMLPGEIREDFKKLPVAVNLFHGDPFLQTEKTYEYLRRLEENRHEGIVVIITKGDVPKDFPSFDLNLHFGLSTFGTDSPYDGGSWKRFLRNMDACRELRERNSKYRYSVEFRPIIRNLNDSDECFRRVAKAAAEHGTGIGYCGLQMSENLRQRLAASGTKFDEYPGLKFGMKKMLPDSVHERLRRVCGELGIPAFKKTSCLLAWSHGLERDPNAHYYRPGEVRCAGCPMEKKCKEFKRKNQSLTVPIPFKHELLFRQDHECELYRNGLCAFPSYDCLHIKGTLIKIKEPVSTSDVRLIKWLTGFTVDAEFREYPYISKKWVEPK